MERYIRLTLCEIPDKLADRLLPCDVAMTSLPKSKVRSIGVSNFTAEHVSFTDHPKYCFICIDDTNARILVNSWKRLAMTQA